MDVRPRRNIFGSKRHGYQDGYRVTDKMMEFILDIKEVVMEQILDKHKKYSPDMDLKEYIKKMDYYVNNDIVGAIVSHIEDELDENKYHDNDVFKSIIVRTMNGEHFYSYKDLRKLYKYCLYLIDEDLELHNYNTKSAKFLV